ncbi:MAG TPA: hypothetical protein DHB48_13395 [Sphingobium sp.]|jgi:IclR family transcriptional regulator, acetate operon repressor|nr:hypothetical protein [Sphingobium sp.]HCW61968.1 hypothetical protein [Sphingobium sp.]|tara:strand:- start:20489 stop:21286 length:798 start_codon:yes stop_codon:yes gene_type:complete
MAMDMPRPDPQLRPPVNSVVQAIAILRHLGALSEPQGVTAIARALGLNPSSCFNVLKTLLREDLVSFDAVSKRYALGLGTIDLARLALGRDAVVRAAHLPMATLAGQFDAAVGLWRLTEGERLVLVALAESAEAMRIHMVVGQRQPAAAGATGRAVLARRALDDAAIAAVHAGIRWKSAPDPQEFIAQVRAAAVKGWAIDNGQINHGISTVAAAIVDTGGAPRFVLSASMFSGRENAEGMDAIGAAMRQAADAIAQSAYAMEMAT